jgi:CheY-like chemotaxis protein
MTQMKDGDEAMKLLLENDGVKYDLMILDLNMPRVGGLELLSRVRALPSWRDTPILVLTSSLSPQERAQAAELGASDYVRKAPDLQQFLSSVGQAARRLLQPV